MNWSLWYVLGARPGASLPVYPVSISNPRSLSSLYSLSIKALSSYMSCTAEKFSVNLIFLKRGVDCGISYFQSLDKVDKASEFPDAFLSINRIRSSFCLSSYKE